MRSTSVHGHQAEIGVFARAGAATFLVSGRINRIAGFSTNSQLIHPKIHDRRNVNIADSATGMVG